MVRVALIQQQCTLEKQENIQKAIGYIREASSKGANIICLQELFNTIYFCYEADKKYYDWAEPIPGPTIDKIREVARKEKVVIVAPIYQMEMKVRREGTGHLWRGNCLIFLDLIFDSSRARGWAGRL